MASDRSNMPAPAQVPEEATEAMPSSFGQAAI